MSDARALDEPLSDTELDELEAFLASDAVPQDCMDLEMLDGYLTAVASGPESIQPSEWLPGVWSEGGRAASPAYGSSEQAQQIMGLMLRHMVGIERTLAESPTRFRPLLYLPDRDKERREGEDRRESEPAADRAPPEATAWCEGYMAGVKLRDEEWQPLYDAPDARDWIFPVEALDRRRRQACEPRRRAAGRRGPDLPLLARSPPHDGHPRRPRAPGGARRGSQGAAAAALNSAEK
jgi:uncharacterized protein